MIVSYGFSIQGLSHRKKSAPCQDANLIRHLDNGWVVAAVADGLGSSAYADVAASLAVSVFNRIDDAKLSEMLGRTVRGANDQPEIWDGELACSILRKCFADALNAITEEANFHNRELSDYYTTLTAVIYDGKNLAYGHCGDGGIIGLTGDGVYQIITQVQKGDEWSTVVPLSNGMEYWVFESLASDFCSIALMTDGLFDAAAPSLLRGDETTGGVYIRFIRQFMDASVLGITLDNAVEIKKSTEAFFEEGPSPSITDDKTLVCLIRTDYAPTMKDETYYTEPDWVFLRGKMSERLYTTDTGGETP